MPRSQSVFNVILNLHKLFVNSSAYTKVAGMIPPRLTGLLNDSSQLISMPTGPLASARRNVRMRLMTTLTCPLVVMFKFACAALSPNWQHPLGTPCHRPSRVLRLAVSDVIYPEIHVETDMEPRIGSTLEYVDRRPTDYASAQLAEK